MGEGNKGFRVQGFWMISIIHVQVLVKATYIFSFSFFSMSIFWNDIQNDSTFDYQF